MGGMSAVGSSPSNMSIIRKLYSMNSTLVAYRACHAQSLALANLFVWMETLFFLNYRPKLQALLHERVSKNLQDLQSQKEPLLKPSEGAK